MYMSKPSQQVANDVQVAARSCVPTPIVLEILDDEDEQLAPKVKQQQAKLKKVMDALEHDGSQKGKWLRKRQSTSARRRPHMRWMKWHIWRGCGSSAIVMHAMGHVCP